jgi:ABC-type Fe3+/spermidine/putrescine transport system ATPase subunit
MTALTVERLTKAFGDVRVLDGLSMTVEAGRSVAILGPSGSGKTTLLRLLAGLELPDDGEIRVDTAVLSRPGWALEPHRRGMGMVFQYSALWPHMTVAQNIQFGLQHLPKAEARRRLGELLAGLGLAELGQRFPDQISGGQARRVALARALAPSPQWLLLDEPLTNLDAALKESLLELILARTAESGTAMIYVTHDEAEAARIAPSSDIRVLEAGRLAAARVPAAPAATPALAPTVAEP